MRATDLKIFYKVCIFLLWYSFMWTISVTVYWRLKAGDTQNQRYYFHRDFFSFFFKSELSVSVVKTVSDISFFLTIGNYFLSSVYSFNNLFVKLIAQLIRNCAGLLANFHLHEFCLKLNHLNYVAYKCSTIWMYRLMMNF